MKRDYFVSSRTDTAEEELQKQRVMHVVPTLARSDLIHAEGQEDLLYVRHEVSFTKLATSCFTVKMV